MTRLILFNALLLLVCGYAWIRGGGPERVAAAAMLAAAFLTRMVQPEMSVRFHGMEAGVLIVDLGLCIAFYATAIRSERYWPLWITALQIVGLAIHAVKLLNPQISSWTYASMLAFWSYPILLVLFVGAVRHQGRVKDYGSDPGWR